MIRFLIVLKFICFVFVGFSQQVYTIQGKVISAKDKEPLPFVNIIINGTAQGTTSDIDGKFFYQSPKPIEYADFSFIGYYIKRENFREASSVLTVELEEKLDQLKEAVVFPGENPAHRIIKNAVAHREENNPYNIEAFNYKTYSKFVVNVETDTLTGAVDTVERKVNDSTYVELDSSEYRLKKFMDKQHIFFMETVTERNYLAPSRDNETVLANRTSGFDNPLFSLIATQMQSFSFYEDYVGIGGDEYLNPITKGSTARYFFILEDTLYNSVTDTVFIISFRPKPNYGFKPMKGLLYINSTDWAVQNVVAEPFENSGIQISINQEYKRYGAHTWFPVQLDAKLMFNSLMWGTQPIQGNMRTSLKEINLNANLERKDISRAAITIEENIKYTTEDLLLKYRNDTLSAKELETYRMVDSLSDAEDLEKKFNLLMIAAQGYIPLYYVNIELNKLYRYNTYEGSRLGLGLRTSNLLSKKFNVGGYFAYGTKDKVWKYGWDAEVFIHKHSNLKLVGGYKYDIGESGSVDFLQKPSGRVLANYYRSFYIQQWDELTAYHGGITYDIFPKLHVEARFQRENRWTIGDYYYNTQDGSANPWENGFNYAELITSLRYSPNEKYIEGPNFGKISFDAQYPILYVQYTKGLKDVLGGNFEYNKLDMRFEYVYKTVRAGEFSFGVQTGIVFEDIPFSKLYAPSANNTLRTEFFQQLRNIADRTSFETMGFNEFLNDKYIQLFFRQDLKSLLFRKNEFAPHIELVSRAMWGGLRAPQRHQNINTESLDKGYYESGIELNRLYSISFFGVGVGVYYRYGPYTNPNVEDNLAIKLTSKFSF